MRKQLNRRDTIYRAAARLFFTKGYHATSMRGIARAVRLEQSTLYHYYSSKQSLLYEIIKQAVHDLTTDVESAMGSTQTTREQISVFLKIVVSHALKQREQAGLLHEMRNLNRQQKNELRQLYVEYITKFCALLDNGIKEKVIHPCDTKFKALMLLSNAVSLAQWYRPDGPLTEDDIAEIFVDQTVQGLFIDK